MAKGFGIAALVLAIIALFVPVFHMFVSAIAILCASVAALAGDRAFATATPIIALVNTFMSPSTWVMMGSQTEGQRGAFVVAILIGAAAPFVAMALNATGKIVLDLKDRRLVGGPDGRNEIRATGDEKMSTRSVIRAAWTVIATALVMGAGVVPGQALDAYWHGARSGNWHSGMAGNVSNWYSQKPPRGAVRAVPDNTAIFARGARRAAVTTTAPTAIKKILFPADAPKYTFLISGQGNNGSLRINGGIVNQSKTASVFRVRDGGQLMLANATLSGPVDLETEGYWWGNIRSELIVTGKHRSTATVTNRAHGVTSFHGSTSADRMTITNKKNGLTRFYDNSTGGSAILRNEAGGTLAFCNNNPYNKLSALSVTNAGLASIDTCNVTLERDFTQGTAGTLKMWGLGSLKVKGTVRLAGRLEVHDPLTSAFHNFELISAGKQLIGKFNSVKLTGLPPGLRVRIDYVGKRVLVKIIP